MEIQLTHDFVETKIESAKSEAIKWNVASVFAAAGMAIVAARLLH